MCGPTVVVRRGCATIYEPWQVSFEAIKILHAEHSVDPQMHHTKVRKDQAKCKDLRHIGAKSKSSLTSASQFGRTACEKKRRKLYDMNY